FQRVRSARHDDAGETGVARESLVDPPGELQPLVERQRIARHVGKLLALDAGVAIEVGNRVEELFVREPTARPVRDGAASRDQADTWRILRDRGERGEQEDAGHHRGTEEPKRRGIHAGTIPYRSGWPAPPAARARAQATGSIDGPPRRGSDRRM